MDARTPLFLLTQDTGPPGLSPSTADRFMKTQLRGRERPRDSGSKGVNGWRDKRETFKKYYLYIIATNKKGSFFIWGWISNVHLPPGKKQGSPASPGLWGKGERPGLRASGWGGRPAHRVGSAAIKAASHLSYPRASPGLDAPALPALTPPPALAMESEARLTPASSYQCNLGLPIKN